MAEKVRLALLGAVVAASLAWYFTLPTGEKPSTQVATSSLKAQDGITLLLQGPPEVRRGAPGKVATFKLQVNNVSQELKAITTRGDLTGFVLTKPTGEVVEDTVARTAADKMPGFSASNFVILPPRGSVVEDLDLYLFEDPPPGNYKLIAKLYVSKPSDLPKKGEYVGSVPGVTIESTATDVRFVP